MTDDPTAAFTDIQWYMYQQRNVAYFAAFTRRNFDDDKLLETARSLVELAPQLSFGFPGGLPDWLLRRVITREVVTSLLDFPERWLNRGEELFADPSLPLFRIRYAATAGPDQAGRAGFILVQASHALVEGADSALLSRSKSAAHPLSEASRDAAPLVKAAAIGAGAVLAGLHLVAANLMSMHPGPFRAATLAYPRAALRSLAREYGVRQRALLFALVLAALFDCGSPAGKRRISSTYSSIDDGGGADRDTYMRMRMRFAMFENRADFLAFVRALDARLELAEARDSGFNDALNAQGVRVHRRLSRLIPFAYSPRLFQFMPYDVVLGLIPPHRLAGPLTQELMEPVYAGALLEGANACVIVPNRRLVTFNFYVQETLAGRVGLLGKALISRSELMG
ncbi:MAG TPA: hypothetical protein VHA07_01810 [Devosia sp.]|nr:hypothetical protein [Devosia sp.]